MNLVSSPGGKEFWRERGYLFGEEFRRYVETDLMKRTPHPDAKPMGAFSIAQRSELLRALRHAGGLANFAIVTGGIVGENSDSPKSAAGS